MRHRAVLASLVALLAPALARADDVKTVAADDPAHNELRALRDDVLDAFNKKDLDRLLSHVHPNVAVTWQNGEVSRGRDGIRAYYKKMMEGPDRVVDSVTAKAEVDPEAEEKSDTIIGKLFKEIGPRFADRPGGYTRIIKRHERRLGDGGKTAFIELLKAGEKKVQKRAPAPAPAPRVTAPPPPAPAPEATQTPPATENPPSA